MNYILRVIRRVVTDEYLDLYVLSAAALVFTVLGVEGISDTKVLSSVILALLAFLALSQIRSRRYLISAAKARESDPFSLFRSSFPERLSELRAEASSLTLIGVALSRTIQVGARVELRQMLAAGGTIRVLVVDPRNEALLVAASHQGLPDLTPDRLKKRIEATLDELAALRVIAQGRVEVRVASSFLPTIGMNIINGHTADGLMVVQHLEYRPEREAAPILQLKAADGFWFHHFRAEGDRMWDNGSPWPPAA